MCLVIPAILPWLLDLIDNLGYNITIRGSEQTGEFEIGRGGGGRETGRNRRRGGERGSASAAAAAMSSAVVHTGTVQLNTTPGRCLSINDKDTCYLRIDNSQDAVNIESGKGSMGVTGTMTPADPMLPASPVSSTGRSSKTCCFWWCCCCSCSCVTVQNNGEDGHCLPSEKKLLKSVTNDSVRKSTEDYPTLEEVRLWSESFDKLIQSSKGQDKFREFLRSEYSEENVLFWLACEDLKKQINPEIIEEKARAIYEDYISILSPKEVSLDSGARDVINRNMVRPSPHTFDDAQLQIYTLMHRDSYPRFLNSNIYKQLLIHYHQG